jgi:NitT/TauT family transport system permease protein
VLIQKKYQEKKRRHPRFWGLYAKPSKSLKLFFGATPFAVMIIAYVVASMMRHSVNPDDKLLPTLFQMASAIRDFAYNSDEQVGGPIFQWLWNPEILPQLRMYLVAFLYSNFVTDTCSSLFRIICGISLSTICGLIVGLNMGLFVGFRYLLKPTTVFLLNIPPLAIPPILLITFGVGEMSKVMLIFIGTYPVITMSVFLAVRAISWDLIIKAQTLGASQFGVAYRIMLPMIMPNLLNVVSITLGASWLFLISAEAIAATTGLGYRIFLVRRYLSMDVIIPYVLWITFLAYLITSAVSRFIAKHYPWFNTQNGDERK